MDLAFLAGGPWMAIIGAAVALGGQWLRSKYLASPATPAAPALPTVAPVIAPVVAPTVPATPAANPAVPVAPAATPLLTLLHTLLPILLTRKTTAPAPNAPTDGATALEDEMLKVLGSILAPSVATVKLS